MELSALGQLLDPYLIRCYRITGCAPVDFMVGTLALACLAVLLGHLTSSLAHLALRNRIGQDTATAARYQELSIQALKAGDQQAYQAANRLANEAFGKSFFLQAGMSAGFLWPIFLALAWMQERFLRIEIPLVVVPYSLGFVGIFIILYILAYFLFKRVKCRIPCFRDIKVMLDASSRKASETAIFVDPLTPGAEGKP
ncbi:MAG: hypothetical protein WA433_10135 [Desulfobaccales bacterium]